MSTEHVKSNLIKTRKSWSLYSILFLIILYTIFSLTKDNKSQNILRNSLIGEKAYAEANISIKQSKRSALLKAATNIDPNPIKSDELIPVNNGVMLADIARSNNTYNEEISTAISIYTVKTGDTLANIAETFNVSENTILWANNISKNTSLKAGQVIVILPVTGITHKVSKGETIKSIVKKYNADLDEVLKYNDITISSLLQAGSTIIIPDVEIKSNPKTKTSAGTNPAHDTDGPYYPGYFMRPVSNAIKSQGLHGFNAIDLAAPVGTPILASHDGTVILSKIGGWNGGYGNLIIINHPNGTQTVYAHASKVYVNTNDKVKQGQIIAEIGMTGKTTGPHLHFEIRGAKNPF
jgi:murein DD-endopeptidase MepM/ murein hydrolase activator NlpD